MDAFSPAHTTHTTHTVSLSSSSSSFTSSFTSSSFVSNCSAFTTYTTNIAHTVPHRNVVSSSSSSTPIVVDSKSESARGGVPFVPREVLEQEDVDLAVDLLSRCFVDTHDTADDNAADAPLLTSATFATSPTFSSPPPPPPPLLVPIPVRKRKVDWNDGKVTTVQDVPDEQDEDKKQEEPRHENADAVDTVDTVDAAGTSSTSTTSPVHKRRKVGQADSDEDSKASTPEPSSLEVLASAAPPASKWHRHRVKRCGFRVCDRNAPTSATAGMYAAINHFRFDMDKVRNGFVEFQLTGLHVRAIHTVLSFQSGEYADPRYPCYRVKHTARDGKTNRALDVASLEVELSKASRFYESETRGRPVATEIAWTFPRSANDNADNADNADNNNNNDEPDVIMRVTHHVSNNRSFLVAFSGITDVTQYRRQASTPRKNRTYKKGAHVNELPSIDLDVQLLLHKKWLTPAAATTATTATDVIRKARLQALSQCMWQPRFRPMPRAFPSDAAAFAPAVHDMNSRRVHRFGDPLPLSFQSPDATDAPDAHDVHVAV